MCIILLDEESEKWGDGGTEEQRWNGQRGCGVTLDAKSVHTFNIFYNFLFLYFCISVYFLKPYPHDDDSDIVECVSGWWSWLINVRTESRLKIHIPQATSSL